VRPRRSEAGEGRISHLLVGYLMTNVGDDKWTLLRAAQNGDLQALAPGTCQQVQVGAAGDGRSAWPGHDCSIRSAADNAPHARSGRATSASRAILG
jgi:hypothetical protein